MAQKETKEIKHDNLNHQQTLEAQRIWRAQNILEVNEESRRTHCAYCGKEFGKEMVDYWFEEKFHLKCVNEMKGE